ncbi:hypothetical protein QNN88_07825 [Citrobacter sp. ANG330]|uniref:hypothetical protein n=1 Tax=Citrobacter sp. ANG330 TaxID=3048142 RepID=UPI0039C0FA50
MKHEKFSPDVLQRLFVAVEEDDIIDRHAALPEHIPPYSTEDTLRRCYDLCLQFWQEGFTRSELLRLVLKQLQGGELSENERMQYKYIRARYKHLRFALRLYRKTHQSGLIFGKTTVFLGHFQDGFRNGNRTIIATYGRRLRVCLSRPVWWVVQYSLRHSQPESANGFAFYCQTQMRTLRDLIAQPQLTGSEFHTMRKIISQQVSYFDTLRALDPDNHNARAISRFLATINGLMGDRHDEMVTAAMEMRTPYDEPCTLDSEIRGRIEQWLDHYPLQMEQHRAPHCGPAK